MKKFLVVIQLYVSITGVAVFRYNNCILYQRNYTYLMMQKANLYNCPLLKNKLDDWQFSQSRLVCLPLDIEKQNYVRRNVKDAIFSVVLPTPLTTELKLVSCSEDALINILDMSPSIAETSEFVEFIAGNKLLSSSIPLAHRYGGHQFGYWAMQLGDGRAILLGEYINSAGERWELQLKGSGRTPYSRDADGRAVLRSSVREFLCSEAMYYLGIPTSRAAALIVSRDPVLRDQFYNGYTITERAAVVLRLAQSWFRFGSLEILTRNKEFDSLKKLVDFIITEHYPEIGAEDEDRYVQLFRTVAHKTMDLAVDWMRVGFTHGVLNTDNMSILAVTIDYGPFGFVEAYNSNFIPNTSDREGRYSYSKQLEIAIWNLQKLSEAMFPLLSESQISSVMSIMKYMEMYSKSKYRLAFLAKLGLKQEINFTTDDLLIMQLLQMMEQTEADFTMTFRELGDIPLESLKNVETLRKHGWSLPKLASHRNYVEFIEMYQKRLEQEKGTDDERRKLMSSVNPRYVLRNWMAQSAIEKAEKDDFSEVRFLLEVFKTPYTLNEEAEKRGYADPSPDWASNIRVSCSS
ncbi:hypothetical protein L9F63_006944 [Diploptera punctata]|uniref:Selenoprotein O n=1 Tax=Diploptera punctata TaxID=6984 RepID=A0AAD7Z9F9_DIPPU|nr:hypothetical protein L9F63_006944 [Diploptera punctata]